MGQAHVIYHCLGERAGLEPARLMALSERPKGNPRSGLPFGVSAALPQPPRLAGSRVTRDWNKGLPPCACRIVPQNEAVSRGGDREDAFATFGQNRNPHGVANPLRQFSVQLELECVQFFAGI